MDLRYLQTFKEIVREGSFSGAARKLSYTQSTITFHMDQLEKELDTMLFEKVGRRMVLTKAGEEFIPYVEEVLSALDKMKNFQSDLAECKGTLRLGAPESLLCFRFPQILKVFHQRAPRVHLYLRSMNSRNVQEALKDDLIDIGAFYLNEQDVDDSLVWEKGGTYPLVLFGSPRIKRTYSDFVTPHQDFPLLSAIVQPMPGSLGRKFNAYLEEKDIHLGNMIEIRSTQTIINLAKNDVGICYLPRFVVEKELQTGELVELETDMKADPISSAYGYRKNKWISPAIKMFLEILKGHCL